MTFKERKDQLFSRFSNDIGIDLGTANTLVYVRGKGIVVNEPSVVAVNQKTGQVVAVGQVAKDMLGRTPAHIVAVRPLVEGVISDFEVTEEMLSYLMQRAGEFMPKKFLGPRVVVGVPSSVTNVEVRAVRDATKNAGAREVYIVEQPMAGAIGIRLPIHDPVGSMIIDIGGGTTDIAVISLGGIVRSKNIKVAGDKLNNDIISYIRNEFKILIGETTAEQVKKDVGTVISGEPHETTIRGRDLITGLPREVIITDSDIREAIGQSIDLLLEAAKEVLEITPPEILSDVMKRGIHLVGGGALINGLDALLFEMLNIPITIAEDPLTATARGAGIILEDLEKYRSVLIESEDDIPSNS
ncbi:MAG: rod shape-determining protein [Candidatus Taylorbacteria bacterium RIFCSPHIGHO2_02_FULL_45_28]|uniref:Cell shape-determining protein MreB n=1 Tax=Candidatus Taylorbacteria bacterium RIFCSPHIGHO2_12_FULL_45_16 TaxID=1802315 RepID=A0A1G2MZD0_9BACT|nr:MAG: rod shape-determining protein [Candidatus Taylorbacteria bacterium RIFCSPHIGHO2_01_FULL_44_110]OHA25527.1 MAG: rod shape-determining protein [Candidatus Taylorbacteria bacterium RIFCSPHIGHO2_02_FULL_45_28]OHA29194.1 MAG: rod shape-determining protein [Candidatus Taylorbacteria bacterium RIFCSPHIGHO2_12_FULL_45_16]OHA33416.1 MAG: rod shape-determining protein [Candidatus Taylorbacteria bacterium RIFCSPLOWO2_01_FULL_45_59]OHA39500.1 MAG: rod shape-determining protein [Candidatus Taylorbac